MTEIILARHGETSWNVREIFRGRIDIELNATGIRQATLLAEHLSSTRIEAIYSSPLKRALQTAAAVADYHQLDVETAAELIDIDYGRWQGLPQEEIKEKYRGLYDQWNSHPELAAIPDGESLNAVRERAITVIHRIVAEYQGTVLLVSHRVINKVLICALLGLDNSHFWQIRQDTCGITTFYHENERFILTEHNNTSYLQPLNTARLSDF